MKKLLSIIIPSILLAGVLTSCNSTSPIIEEAQLNIYTQNFDSAYASLDRYIEQNPDNGLGYYYKALANSEHGFTIQPPSDRKPIYRDFRENITTSRDLFSQMEEAPSESGEVDNLVLNTWGREHNAALPYAIDDSVMATVDEPLKRAVAHLENAVIINPDSTLSYDVLSQIHFMDNNYEAAAEVLEQSMELKDPPPAEDYDRISVYYAQSGNPEKAVDILETGLELYPDSVSLTQKLADNYMNVGERGKAIDVLEGLIEDDPQNAQYRLVLGTVLLSITESLTSSISDKYEEIYDLKNQMRNASDEEAENIEQQLAEIQEEIDNETEEINGLNDRAEEALMETIRLRPNDEQAHNALGVLYQNKAALIFAERNNADDLERVNELDEIANGFLTDAMEYYEKTVELNPENMGAWQSLYSVYINLDMPEKAQEAQEKLGM
ncbi:tetratricopeptide repeat protein [Gracilimonas sp.]|uniref:tetratricopeptide repeat protein n=1 Tax=Gracilimonas sp. TaxID=1974203 RepID=UPI002871766D|nr:tetratricopeptide repeat protein [Gracilimonas sp.]